MKNTKNEQKIEAGYQGARRTFDSTSEASTWLTSRGFNRKNGQWEQKTYYGGTSKAYCREI